MASKTFQDHFGVIDLETLGVGPDSVILSLGLTVGKYGEQKTFDELMTNGLRLKFDLKEQLNRGRKTSERVIKWWYEQAPAARKVLIPNPTLDVSLYGLLDHINFYCDKLNISLKEIDFYDRNSFDLTKLQYLFEEDLNIDVPWNYHQTFDIPTAFRFLGFDRYAGIHVNDIPGAIYHEALNDAAVDHIRLQKVFAHDGTV